MSKVNEHKQKGKCMIMTCKIEEKHLKMTCNTLDIQRQFDIIFQRATQMRVEIILIIILSLAIFAQSTTEVDNLNLLLPELKDSSRTLPLQLITAKGGCYTWASSAPSILSVKPHENKSEPCSKQALVEVVKAGPYSSSIYVTATDAATESILNIPVRIRKLNKIFIATKSRMMNLKQIQQIELHAHDSDENTFTSLEGLRFSWTLEQRIQIIQTVSLTHTHLYLPLRTRENIQRDGFQSDVLVVRALNPGNLKIYVKCIEPGYEHLTDQITLSVHERFQLKPGPILNMVPASSYQLYLERPTNEIISLPQSYYNIKVCPGFYVNSSLYLTVSDFTSKCEIKVQDTRTIPPYSSSITVIVQNPTEIKIVSDPIIIVGQKSPFEVQFFNSKHEQLYGQPKNLHIQSDFSIDISKNLIVADKKKVGLIRASLLTLRSQLLITSYLPIRPLLPTNSLHLPLEETFKLRLVGGSGIYDFNVNNEVGLINSLGVLVCKQVGLAQITVVDRSHPANKAIINLKVSTYASIKSLEQQKEVNKDQWGYFYIMGRSNDQQTFTQCLNSQFSLTLPSHKLQIDKKVNFTESIKQLTGENSRLVQQILQPTSLLKGKAEEIISNFNSYVESSEITKGDLRNYIYGLENYGVCETIRFRSLVSLQDRALIELIGGEVQTDTKVPLRVYEPITTAIKEDDLSFLLTPLSSLTWNYFGGSYFWPNSFTRVTINNAKVNPNSKPEIVCPNSEKSSTTYELKLQNEQTKFLLFPASQKSIIYVACKFPKKLQLLFERGEFYDEILVNPNVEIAGSVEPLDENGKPFYNSSNLEYNYIASNGDIQGKDTKFKYNAKRKSDKVKIYTQNLKEKLNFRKVEVDFDITVVQPVKIDHLLFDPLVQTPTSKDTRKQIQIVTLFTPKKPYVLRLGNISPLVQVKCNESVSCEKHQNRLNVNLLNIGKGFVSLKDKRVYGSIEWIFIFTIVQVDEVTVTGDRDHIPQGENVNITINNLYNGKIISPLLYEDNYLQLSIHRNLKIVEQSGNRFLVVANSAGTYEIHGQQGYPKTIRSKTPFVLHVYQRIAPDVTNSISRKQGNIIIVQGESTVVIGCKRILRVKGGPKQMEVTFTNEDNLIVSAISSNTFSIVGKREGSYSLTLQAKNHGQTIALLKLKIIVSKVQSVELTSIDEPVIGAQFRILPRFKVGENQVEGCVCDFDYKWSTDKKIISLGSSTSLGFLAGGGVNATALREGNELISLQIRDKSSNKVIGQAQKYIKILKQIDLHLPTLIGKPHERTQTLRISPLTSYSFGRQYKLESREDVIKINGQSNSIQASRKLGFNTVKIQREGHKSQIVEVEVTFISGLFIQNDDGALSLQSNSIQSIPIYLYDNHGKLFVTPLNNLEIYVLSSNPDVLNVTLSLDQKHLILQGVNVGTSVLTIFLAGRNVYDSIAVSVGNLIIPSTEVRILQHGTVKYSLPTESAGKWVSSDPEVAKINERTGQTRALEVGKTKISNGNVFGWLYVTFVSSIQQINFEQLSQGSYQIVYTALCNGKNGQQEISNFFSTGEQFDNNFRPTCVIDNSKWFDITTQFKEYQGRQRLFCTVRSLGSPVSRDFPSTYTITVVDNTEKELGRFHYPSFSGFIFDRTKSKIALTSSQPKQSIAIRTSRLIQVKGPSGSREWIRSNFDESLNIQTISIDMSGEAVDKNWELELSNGEQRERIEISYKHNGESAESHSFFSLSLDWPEYLIILMAIVFGILCFIQYYSEQKIKNS